MNFFAFTSVTVTLTFPTSTLEVSPLLSSDVSSLSLVPFSVFDSIISKFCPTFTKIFSPIPIESSGYTIFVGNVLSFSAVTFLLLLLLTASAIILGVISFVSPLFSAINSLIAKFTSSFAVAICAKVLAFFVFPSSPDRPNVPIVIPANNKRTIIVITNATKVIPLLDFSFVLISFPPKIFIIY